MIFHRQNRGWDIGFSWKYTLKSYIIYMPHANFENELFRASNVALLLTNKFFPLQSTVFRATGSRFQNKCLDVSQVFLILQII